MDKHKYSDRYGTPGRWSAPLARFAEKSRAKRLSGKSRAKRKAVRDRNKLILEALDRPTEPTKRAKLPAVAPAPAAPCRTCGYVAARCRCE